MPASPADSAIYRQLFGDSEVATLFTDSAEIRAMLLVEGALARVQGEAGLIPAEAAAFIDRAAREVQIDPSALAAETARNGVPVPGFLAAFRKAAEAPQMMQYLHWGATSQDIMDTALALRQRRMLDIWDQRFLAILARLAELAETHASLPMAARTYGQHATPTSFGAVAASWGMPLLRWRSDLPALRAEILNVSLSGAAGTLAAMGPEGPAIRAALAKALALGDPGHSWHSDRSGMARLGGYAAGLAASIGKMGEDILLMTQSGINEISLTGSGGSSTMPQKENPVAASALVALSRLVIGLAPVLQGAGLHRQQRDGAAWFTEWLTLPQVCLTTSRLLSLTQDCLDSLHPNPDAMKRPLTEGLGLIHAEALTFALAAHMPRPEAQALVTRLCKTSIDTGQSLPSLVAPHLPPSASGQPHLANALGTAPSEARSFAAKCHRAIASQTSAS